MSPVLVRSDRPPAASGERVRPLFLVAVVAVAVVAFLQGLAIVVRSPTLVGRVTLENPTPHVIDVEVGDGAHDGWLGLTALQPGERLDVHDVIDQGDRWTFHFTSGSFDGGEVALTRSALGRAGWDVQVPGDVDARITAQQVANAKG